MFLSSSQHLLTFLLKSNYIDTEIAGKMQSLSNKNYIALVSIKLMHLLFVSEQGWPSYLDAFYPYAIVNCYIEFKLSYLKNRKLFSIRVKELFEPIVFSKKSDGFLLFLRAVSWEPDFWISLGDFALKNVKMGKKSVFNYKFIW